MHYKQMTALHAEYRAKGFEIFAFPCNQFFAQEPNPNEKIKEFVQVRKGAKFTLFSKVQVNGEATHPVFKYLRLNSELYNPRTKMSKNIPWNFAKFLVDSSGHVRHYYAPNVEPNKMRPAI